MKRRRHPSKQPPGRAARLRAQAVASRLLRAGIAAVCAGVPPLATAQGTAPAAAAEQRRFDIPPGPLNTAITRFVAETGVLLAGDAALTAGKTRPGVQGRFSADEALKRLLAGTGLSVSAQRSGSYILLVAAARPPPPCLRHR